MRAKLPTLRGILFVAFCIVFIVTTRKRLIVMTLIFALSVLSLAVYFGMDAHNNWVVKPGKLADRLLAVANGQQTLSVSDYDAESIRADAKRMVLMQLSSDLALANLPGDINGSALLSSQATLFLADEQMLQRWLVLWLSEHVAGANNAWETISLSKQQRQLRSGEFCMMIAAVQHHWRLQSVGSCQALAASNGG